jgi:hypothetical protein
MAAFTAAVGQRSEEHIVEVAQSFAFVLLVSGALFAIASVALRDPRVQRARDLARWLASLCLALGLVLAVVSGLVPR